MFPRIFWPISNMSKHQPKIQFGELFGFWFMQGKYNNTSNSYRLSEDCTLVTDFTTIVVSLIILLSNILIVVVPSLWNHRLLATKIYIKTRLWNLVETYLIILNTNYTSNIYCTSMQSAISCNFLYMRINNHLFKKICWTPLPKWSIAS